MLIMAWMVSTLFLWVLLSSELKDYNQNAASSPYKDPHESWAVKIIL